MKLSHHVAQHTRRIQPDGSGNPPTEVRRNVPLAILVAICSMMATFATTVSFSNETVFQFYHTMMEDVARYLGVHGAFTGALAFCAIFVVELLGAIRFRNAGARVRWWSVGVGLVLALTVSIPMHNASHVQGDPLATTLLPPAVDSRYHTRWYWLYIAIRYIGYATLLCALMTLLFTWWVNRRSTTQDPERGHASSPLGEFLHTLQRTLSRSECMFSAFSLRNSALLFGIIAVCWLPWTYFLWPANIAADTVAQLMWARTGIVWDPSSHEMLPGYQLSDHHPWFDTLIYGAFDKFGLRIGSEAWGLWTLAFLQTMLTAAVFAVILNYLGGRLRMSWQFCLAGLVFVSLNPIFPRLEMSVVKDSTVMPFFLLLMLLVVEYIRRIRSDVRLSVPLVLGIVVLSLLCAEMRKISTEIMLATFLLLAVFLKKRIVSLGIAVLPPVLAMVISSLVFPALHIAPGGKQEMIAIPMQQTAYTTLVHPNELSAADQQAFNAIITCDSARLNDIFTTDPDDGREINSADAIKDQCYNRDAKQADIVRFLAVWAKVGLRHPGSYLKSVPWLHDPFVMGAIYDEGWYVRWGWEEMNSTMLLPQYHSTFEYSDRSQPQKYGAPLYIVLTHMPGLSLFMTEAFYVSWVPLIALALCVLRRDYVRLVLFTPWALTLCTLMLSPAHQTRYSWTLAFGAILIAAIPFMRDAAQSASSAGEWQISGSERATAKEHA